MNAGFFVMRDASEVLKQPDLDTAKSYLRERVQAFVQAHPNTKKENILKADKMIEKGRSKDDLSLSVAQFILAHPSEGLKVI